MNKRDDLKKRVTEVRFSFMGYMYGEDTVDVRKTDGGGSVKAGSMHYHVDTEYCISQDEWDSFISRLYDDLEIDRWKRSYKPDDFIVMDGAFWELGISVEGGRKRIYRGDNVYPDNWDDFESLMKRMIRRKRK